MQSAQVAPPSRGLVLDYNTINTSQTNYVFQTNTTYYISGAVDLVGPTIFEDGAVIKYAVNASITLGAPYAGPVIFWSDPYHPVIFTAKDDDSVGETISGSTGNPSGYAEPTPPVQRW
ncbi:MAG: hypothetical protein ACREC8_05210 [Limisphaerales bacterium]